MATSDSQAKGRNNEAGQQERLKNPDRLVAIKYSYLTVVVLPACALILGAIMRSVLVLIVSLTVLITLVEARVSVDWKTIGFSQMPNE